MEIYIVLLGKIFWKKNNHECLIYVIFLIFLKMITFVFRFEKLLYYTIEIILKNFHLKYY